MFIATKIAPIALAIIMLGLGFGLTISDFLRVIKNFKDFIVGFIFQIILLPVIAFTLIKILNSPIEIAMGVMLIAAAPGGVISNILTKLANGDVALSISLTAVTSLLSVFSVPFIIFISAELLNFSDFNKNISMINVSLKMFTMVTLPVILGMIVRKLAPEFVAKNTLMIQRISIICFVVIFLAIYISEWDKVANWIVRGGTVALLLNLTMMFVGYYFAKIFVSGIEQRKCISLECGLQNGSLAVFVGTQVFSNIAYLVPTAAYALIMFITSTIFVLIIKKTI
ncbi:bile acid:sodium symporter family protein [Pelagibacteraceae bacterium]|nr:bile acid:sodium symporter family protein [Pelagibacteraceae bacterium]